MVDSELDRLIELNESIVNQNRKLIAQNERIIKLLSRLTGDDKSNVGSIDVVVGENGEMVIGENLKNSVNDNAPVAKQNENTEKKSKKDDENESTVLDLKLDLGEVLFVSNSSDGDVDIYKLAVRDCDEFNVVPDEIRLQIEDEIGATNNEIVIENLTGEGTTSQFKVPLFVAFESLNRNMPIDASTVILDDEMFENLPDILKMAIENGASEVHLSLKNAMGILNAPPMITKYLKFYKTKEQILENLF